MKSPYLRLMLINPDTTPFAHYSELAVLELVELYQSQTGLRDTGVSRRALSDSMFVTKLRDGKNYSRDSLLKLELWLRNELNIPLKDA